VIRAVIDTNIFVSALIAPAGNEALIVLAIRQGWVKPYYSAEILKEYAGVLARRKFRFPADEIDGLLALVRSSGERVFATGPIHGVSSPDLGDEKFLACAQAAGVEFIVTGNKRDFPAPGAGIEVINAAELLDKITVAM
jgi:putative PIN family toxin of toxin-antitoxin system